MKTSKYKYVSKFDSARCRIKSIIETPYYAGCIKNKHLNVRKVFTGIDAEVNAAKWADFQLIKAGLSPVNGFYTKK